MTLSILFARLFKWNFLFSALTLAWTHHHEFTRVDKANRKVRRLYHLARWLKLISAAGFLIAFLAAPVRFNG
ncbi:MAG: hypothetical protein ACU84H_14050 [Gammaproteobacteria bacterium]